MVELETGSLVEHLQDQHGTVWGSQWETNPKPPDPRIYRVSLPRTSRYVGCPVKGYEGQETMLTKIWIQSMHCHIRDTIVITDKRN